MDLACPMWRMDGVPIIEVALRFTPAESAALPNGTGLVQGTCARADRPLRVEEPALIRFTMLLGDSTGTSPSWSSGGVCSSGSRAA
jgi:hypothetical protein